MGLGLGFGLNKSKKIASFASTYTDALVTRSTSDGNTPASGATLTALDTFLSDIETEGIDVLLDGLWVFATNGDRAFARYNVLNPGTFDCTENGTLAFTSLEGFTGNGTNAYLNTNFNPSINGVNYTQNSASLGIYLRNNINELKIAAGCREGLTRFSIIPNSGGSVFSAINSADYATGAVASAGLFHGNRTSPSEQNVYLNSALINTNSSSTSNGTPNYNLTILARNFAGTIDQFSTNQASIFFIGANLSSKAANLFTAIEKYMDAIGKGVVS